MTFFLEFPWIFFLGPAPKTGGSVLYALRGDPDWAASRGSSWCSVFNLLGLCVQTSVCTGIETVGSLGPPWRWTEVYFQFVFHLDFLAAKGPGLRGIKQRPFLSSIPSLLSFWARSPVVFLPPLSIYLILWLHQVVLVAHRVFSCDMWPGIKPGPFAWGM